MTFPQTDASEVPRLGSFTVGWITAIETEYLAAIQMLDLEYPELELIRPTGDENVYTLGRVGKLNVVIASLPAGMYGTRSAANIADGLKGSFPMIRIALMVGVAGGAPTAQNDVRLGDVIVGHRIVDYDFGKVNPDGLEHTGDVNKSSPSLLTGVQKVGTRIQRGEIDLDSLVSVNFSGTSRIKDLFQRPQSYSDRLYISTYTHSDACDCLSPYPRYLEGTLSREERKDYDRVKVHSGRIGTADKVVKDARTRDALSSRFKLLCFEMESIGLVDKFPSLLPIRGICDYSDSHKSKQWQGYAAATSAVYAKCLLDTLPITAELQEQLEVEPEDLKRYIEVVFLLVMRVTSGQSTRSQTGLLDANSAIREIQDTVRVLDEQNKRAISEIHNQQSRVNADIDVAIEALKGIEEGQKRMQESLKRMQEHIEKQKATGSPEQRKQWQALNQEVTNESSSLEKMSDATKDMGEDLKTVSKRFGEAGSLIGSNRMNDVSDRIGKGGIVFDWFSKFTGGAASHSPKSTPRALAPQRRQNKHQRVLAPPFDTTPPPRPPRPQGSIIVSPPALPPRPPKTSPSPPGSGRGISSIENTAKVDDWTERLTSPIDRGLDQSPGTRSTRELLTPPPETQFLRTQSPENPPVSKKERNYLSKYKEVVGSVPRGRSGSPRSHPPALPPRSVPTVKDPANYNWTHRTSSSSEHYNLDIQQNSITNRRDYLQESSRTSSSSLISIATNPSSVPTSTRKPRPPPSPKPGHLSGTKVNKLHRV